MTANIRDYLKVCLFLNYVQNTIDDKKLRCYKNNRILTELRGGGVMEPSRNQCT